MYQIEWGVAHSTRINFFAQALFVHSAIIKSHEGSCIPYTVKVNFRFENCLWQSAYNGYSKQGTGRSGR